MTRFVNAGATVRRWFFHSSPSLRSRPSPTIGRRNSNGRRWPAIIIDILDQHPMNGVGGVEQEVVEPEQTSGQDLLLVSRSRPQAQHIATQGEEGLDPREVVVGNWRTGRNEQWPHGS